MRPIPARFALAVAALLTTTTTACYGPCAAPGAKEQWVLGAVNVNGTRIDVRGFETIEAGNGSGVAEYGEAGTLVTEGDLFADRFKIVIDNDGHTFELELEDVEGPGVFEIGDAIAVTMDGVDVDSGTITVHDSTFDDDHGGDVIEIDGAIDGTPVSGTIEVFDHEGATGCA